MDAVEENRLARRSETNFLQSSLDMRAENMDGGNFLSLTRDSVLGEGGPGKVSPEELRVELDENFRAKNSALYGIDRNSLK